jgi:TnpA family transposase
MSSLVCFGYWDTSLAPDWQTSGNPASGGGLRSKLLSVANIDKEAYYGTLDGLARNRINIRIIQRYWDDMLRVAGSLKSGTIRASELLRSLLRSKRPPTLARAIGELGKIPKTLYLLTYIDDEAYRRRILVQLNRHEDRHKLGKATFHGQRGEIRKRYREGQEDQLSALGLVVNAIVLWNTLYMDLALNHLRTEGFEVKEEDVQRIWPLSYQHINFLGRYFFTLPENIAQGQLRDLRNPLENGL